MRDVDSDTSEVKIRHGCLFYAFLAFSIQKIKKYWGGIITFSGKTMPKWDLRLGKKHAGR